MAIFLDYDKSIINVDNYVKKEIDQYDLPYEYNIEDKFIRINFLTAEERENRQYLEKLKHKIKEDIRPQTIEYLNEIQEDGTNVLINSIINYITMSTNLQYKEILDKYDEIVNNIVKDITPNSLK